MASAHRPALWLLSHLCPSQSLLLTVAPAGDTSFQVCTRLAPCHSGFGLTTPLSQRTPGPSHPMQLPALHTLPALGPRDAMSMFYSGQGTDHDQKSRADVCPPTGTLTSGGRLIVSKCPGRCLAPGRGCQGCDIE